MPTTTRFHSFSAKSTACHDNHTDHYCRMDGTEIGKCPRRRDLKPNDWPVFGVPLPKRAPGVEPGVRNPTPSAVPASRSHWPARYRHGGEDFRTTLNQPPLIAQDIPQECHDFPDLDRFFEPHSHLGCDGAAPTSTSLRAPQRMGHRFIQERRYDSTVQYPTPSLILHRRHEFRPALTGFGVFKRELQPIGIISPADKTIVIVVKRDVRHSLLPEAKEPVLRVTQPIG